MAETLRGRFKGLILDMDGVLYRGDEALPGTAELFPALRAAGLSFILLTNNATLTAQEFSKKLDRMGISVEPEKILTSAGATADYLAREHPEGGEVYVLGSASLLATVTASSAFRAAGGQPDFVVVGLDFGLTYRSLQQACSSVRKGARFIATNADLTLPVEGGDLWPGAGSIVAAVQACSGVAPIVIGKPNGYMAEVALERLGITPNEALCVGDRLETDIAFGARAGIATALLLTGVSQREDIPHAEATPNYIFEDLADLMDALGIM
ncbi:MAG TPA: HAD-IIA family hydrolase [Chloroflexia bacterium]|nr:HAD-IIA family hydrolase [Chloroflexia bacterium]